jgi:uncharacterized protein (TIGR00730 family)
MTTPDAGDEKIIRAIHELIALCGESPETFEAELITQQIQTSLKLLLEGHETGQLKLITRVLKEMRYAYRVFREFEGGRRVSIFGSARTPEDHPDYLTAVHFSRLMAQEGWMCITGAANGIMKAGHEGTSKEASFGLSIKLPFESSSNSLMEGDPKLITFRYFFTRKVMFLTHSDAVVAFPGGYGTMDELFEVLTLLQTGKASLIPVVLLEGSQGDYWPRWEKEMIALLLERGWISPEDLHFYYLAKSPEDAVAHIQHFYRRYHSSRYVKDQLVIRLKEPLTADQIDFLNQKYAGIVQSGTIHPCLPYPEENEHLDLPRLTFCHTRRQFGLLRDLIDQINNFSSP